MTEEDNNDIAYDESVARAEASQDVADDYGYPTPEEKINQFTIMKQALDSKNNVKTTYLTRPELGKPLFSMRFYLDCAKMAEIYNSELIKNYFMNKVQNIASSGMSNEGFMMKLNVTNRRDVTRKSVKKSDDNNSKGEA